MKLLRWTLAGAGAYVIYKYSIGKKAKGENVFVSPERVQADVTEGRDVPERASPERAKGKKTRVTRRPRK